MTHMQTVLFSKPPIIDTEKFGIWSELFESHVRGKSQKIWDIIENGNFICDKPAKELTPAEESLCCLNFEAKNVLYAALTTDEIERVYMYKTAKEIWQSLNDTHRGNTQVKSSKINILVHEYELFEMHQDESIDSMFKRFNLVMTTLKGLGRVYPNEDYVRKILRALPSEWMQKITSLEDSRDLSIMTLDDLIGNLKVHEIALKRNKVREQVKKKSIALNVSTPSDEKKEEKASSSKDQSDTLDEVVKLVRNFSKFFTNNNGSKNDRSKEYRHRNEKRSRNSRKDKDENDESSDDEKTDEKKGFCYVCGKKDHYANVCPKRAKQVKTPKAFVGGSWSASEKEDDYPAVCLMADHENEVSTSGYNDYDSYCSDNYYDSENENPENESNKLDVLYKSFHDLAALANRYQDEISNLKEKVSVYEKEVNDGKQKSVYDLDVITKLENKLSEKDICKSCDILKNEIACLKEKSLEKNNCKSCIILNDKIACLEKISCDNIICKKCVTLENEIACLNARCESHEKNDLLAKAFNSSNDKMLKMLNMSNRINCRKGIGSNTCVDKCGCMPIKRFFEKPKFVVKNKTQKPPYVPKMNYVNYMSRKSHAFMYNNKFANPKKSDIPHASFYVYDQYNRKIKLVNKWIPKGMFNVDNPGGMRLWF